MILHVIVATALSAHLASPTDSVRGAAKQATPRPDSTLLALPVPTIKAPNAPAPTIAALVSLAFPSSKRTIEPDARALGVVAQNSSPTVLQAGAPRSAPLTLAMAIPADVSAVAHSTQPAPTTSAPPKVITADGRTVLGTRSTVRFEPLYAVPFPAVFVRPAAPAVADSIVVYKRDRTLRLFYRGVPVKSYFIALGTKPVGDKERAGDQRTPEGLFSVDAHNPASKYHLALHISYPDAAHRARAASLGVDPGGDIMIHGLPDKYSSIGKDHRQDDWTNGCVALTNQEIEEIWHAVPDGTPVQIKP